MSLNYILLENPLNSGENNFIARPTKNTHHDLPSIIELMLRQGSTVTRADILAVLTSFFEAIAHITQNCETINTDLFKTRFSISGVFTNSTEAFDTTRHRINVHLKPSKTLKGALLETKLERLELPLPRPCILEVKDSISGSRNDVISSRGVMEINGSLLKIEGNNPENGVYLLASNGTKNKVLTVVENKPSKLIVFIPTLASGTYQLQINTQYNSGSRSLKRPRSGTFAKHLTIQ